MSFKSYSSSWYKILKYYKLQINIFYISMLIILCNVSQLYMYQFIVTVFDNSSSSKSQSLTPCSNTKSAFLMPYCSRTLCIFCQIVQVPNLQVYQTVQVICHIFCLFFQVLNLYICHTVQVICHMFYHIIQVLKFYICQTVQICQIVQVMCSMFFHIAQIVNL